MNCGEDFPENYQGDARSYDCPNDSENDTQDVHDLRTLLGLLDPDLKLSSHVVVAVDKGEPALVIIDVCTESLIFIYEVLRLLNWPQTVIQSEGTLGALLQIILERSGLEVLALDAGLELLALARTGGTVLAVLAAVLTLLSLLALALPALAGPVAGAELVDVLPVRCDAGLVTGPTLAGGVPRDPGPGPTRETVPPST